MQEAVEVAAATAVVVTAVVVTAVVVTVALEDQVEAEVIMAAEHVVITVIGAITQITMDMDIGVITIGVEEVTILGTALTTITHMLGE